MYLLYPALAAGRAKAGREGETKREENKATKLANEELVAGFGRMPYGKFAEAAVLQSMWRVVWLVWLVGLSAGVAGNGGIC